MLPHAGSSGIFAGNKDQQAINRGGGRKTCKGISEGWVSMKMGLKGGI